MSSRIRLSEISTLPPDNLQKEKAIAETKSMVEQIGELQHALYAEKKQALLVVLQGMDGSGKDGAVNKVFAACSPTGVRVFPFRKPTDEEFAHDFLWRVHKVTPQKGMIQIFVRSHYEDVLIQRVHKWISEERALKRIAAINAFEELLEFDSNTKVVKFFLYLSREQQKLELQERIDDPKKRWKHNPADWKEAELWDQYMNCYEDAINRSSIPWHIVPVDRRWYRDYGIAGTVNKTLADMNPKLPDLIENS
ncbi:MAG TPA: PPK2 family polyphosphate kinase [Nitrososphaera sp.]|jgi:PPK2 family polyphosphate:nucleotide phosphotransferase